MALLSVVQSLLGVCHPMHKGRPSPFLMQPAFLRQHHQTSHLVSQMGSRRSSQAHGGRASSRRTSQLTSYFCRLNFSCRSNFSASRSRMVCHSSLALSLWGQEPAGVSAERGCGSQGAHCRGQGSDATISPAPPGWVSAGSMPRWDALARRRCQPHAWTRATGEVGMCVDMRVPRV